MTNKKMNVIFTNDNGRYYLEAIEDFREISKIHDWDVKKVIDETKNFDNWRLAKEELNNPTTEDTEQFVLIQYLNK